jgi:hypothetical protein
MRLIEEHALLLSIPLRFETRFAPYDFGLPYIKKKSSGIDLAHLCLSEWYPQDVLESTRDTRRYRRH